MLKTAMACALVLAGTSIAPTAQAAGVVTIGWADAAHTKVRITWTEAAPSADTITVVGGGQLVPLGSTTASEPNELVATTAQMGWFWDADLVNKIEVEDEQGTKIHSVGFDRYIPINREPVLTFAPGNAIAYATPADPAKDATPGDPLDLSGTLRWTPRLTLGSPPHDNDNCRSVELATTASPTGTIPSRGEPYALSVDASNEWGVGYHGEIATVTTTTPTMTAPAATAYGTPLTVSGTVKVDAIYQSGMPPACGRGSVVARDRSVVLQGRATSTSPWQAIGSTQVAVGKYSFTLANPGTREYRVVVPNQLVDNRAGYGSSTAPKVVRATTRILSARFTSSTVQYGQPASAYLWVTPQGQQRATLQYRLANGAWQSLLWNQLSGGKGLKTFTWARRGVTAFRWWVPGSTTAAGLKVDSVYSPAFSLTVR